MGIFGWGGSDPNNNPGAGEASHSHG
jgi:hypothetical protein